MSRKTSQLTKFAEFNCADLDSAAKSIAQGAVGLDGKWIALRVDGSVADIDSAVLAAFDDALAEHGSGSFDPVLIVADKEVPDVLTAWETAKKDAPASVLSRLPDVDGRACRYVALTGTRLTANLPATETGEGALNDDERAAFRTGVTDFVRENAQEVRDARSAIKTAVGQQSAAKAFAGSIALDSAMDRLETTCEAGLADKTVDIDLSAKASETAEHPASSSELLSQRDDALSEFAAVSSKGGLGKLLSKSKIKSTGDTLIAATDAMVGARASELIEGLVDKAQPILAQLRSEERELEFGQVISELSKATSSAVAEFDQVQGIDPAVIRRPWTSGAPQPRHYVIADSQFLDQLELSVDATKVSTKGFDGVYVLHAQHGLSVASLTTS